MPHIKIFGRGNPPPLQTPTVPTTRNIGHTAAALFRGHQSYGWMKRIKDSDIAMIDAEADDENEPGVGPTNGRENEDDVMEDEGNEDRGARVAAKQTLDAKEQKSLKQKAKSDTMVTKGYELLRRGLDMPSRLSMSKHALGENPKQMRDAGVELWDYQLEGVGLLAWMESQSPHGAILADEMGLGKTKQVAALVISQGGHTLIICPAGLMSAWEAEFMVENCSPPLRVLVHHGFKKAKSSTELREKYDVVVTSYETLQVEHKRYLDVENAFWDLQQGKPGDGSRPYLPLIAHKGWHRLVLDEAHKIRSLDKSFALAVQQIKATRRIAITGSPFNNSYMDLCSLFRFLRLEPWNDASLFRKVQIHHV